MNVDHFTLNTGSTGGILRATMNRYRPGTTQRRSHDRGCILLFAHGAGFHKEHWEPTIKRIFENDRANQGPTRILEAWAIDCQNHGEAASLNDGILLQKPKILTIHHYAEAFAELYRSGLLGDLRKGIQKVVLVGHSAGAVGIIYTTTLFGPPSTTPFDMIILVDPPLFPPAMANKMTGTYLAVEKAIPSRRSIWKSREAAYEWFKTRPPYKLWDPRILQLYTEHGLRPLPTPFHPNQTGVVLSCSPAHEAAGFAAVSDTFKAFEHFHDMCKVIPIHLVFGARNDMYSRELQDFICDPSAGRVVASVTRVQGTGHLVVQERPDELANVIYAIINISRIKAPKL